MGYSTITGPYFMFGLSWRMFLRPRRIRLSSRIHRCYRRNTAVVMLTHITGQRDHHPPAVVEMPLAALSSVDQRRGVEVAVAVFYNFCDFAVHSINKDGCSRKAAPAPGARTAPHACALRTGDHRRHRGPGLGATRRRAGQHAIANEQVRFRPQRHRRQPLQEFQRLAGRKGGPPTGRSGAGKRSCAWAAHAR